MRERERERERRTKLEGGRSSAASHITHIRSPFVETLRTLPSLSPHFCVPGRGTEAGAALSSHPGVALVAFTGSSPTGRLVAKAAAENLRFAPRAVMVLPTSTCLMYSSLSREVSSSRRGVTKQAHCGMIFRPTTLELGGKSPLVIFEDADVDKAVEWDNGASTEPYSDDSVPLPRPPSLPHCSSASSTDEVTAAAAVRRLLDQRPDLQRNFARPRRGANRRRLLQAPQGDEQSRGAPHVEIRRRAFRSSCCVLSA